MDKKQLGEFQYLGCRTVIGSNKLESVWLDLSNNKEIKFKKSKNTDKSVNAVYEIPFSKEGESYSVSFGRTKLLRWHHNPENLLADQAARQADKLVKSKPTRREQIQKVLEPILNTYTNATPSEKVSIELQLITELRRYDYG